MVHHVDSVSYEGIRPCWYVDVGTPPGTGASRASFHIYAATVDSDGSRSESTVSLQFLRLMRADNRHLTPESMSVHVGSGVGPRAILRRLLGVDARHGRR